ncbi:unnamed protein product [Trifolium pratense]|uniref:Uncharacterized protein n=1 Tax=Trifolium pratense TaxID=57577 RepID=A0ACB0L5R4_TRIPR|nr:unnamed protein product [Trifolium pratense]
MSFAFTSSVAKFYMFLCLVLLLISSCVPEAKLCGRPSRTYLGPCTDWDCDKECIDSELDAIECRPQRVYAALRLSSEDETTLHLVSGCLWGLFSYLRWLRTGLVILFCA